MTDTITRDIVADTITELTTARDRAQLRLTEEAEAYTSKRDRMVRVAHQKATRNSIGSALDDLMEEFGLPRRGYRGYAYGVIRIHAPLHESTVTSARRTLMMSAGAYVPMSATTQVSWVASFDGYGAAAQAEEHCLCDSIERTARDWIVDSYGAEQAASLSFQIGHASCDSSVCPNGDSGGRAHRCDRDETIDWADKPMLRVGVPNS